MKYANYAPTGFDHKGAFLSERQDWLVVPVGQDRDSGPQEQSNFAAALSILGGESETVEVHRFGHWAVGWCEVILAHPSRGAEVRAIGERLESRPLLDEDDCSNREWDAALSWWRDMGLQQRIAECVRFGHSMFAARRDDELPTGDNGSLFQHLLGC